MKPGFASKYAVLFYYAIAMAVLLLVLNWIEFRLLVLDNLFGAYFLAVAVLFTFLGIWLAEKITGSKTDSRQKLQEHDALLSEKEICEKLSKRESEVLELMARGRSNHEIASELFISLNTVKTHVSSILYKLEVKRRSQAVEKARRCRLLHFE